MVSLLLRACKVRIREQSQILNVRQRYTVGLHESAANFGVYGSGLDLQEGEKLGDISLRVDVAYGH
jgi:hypothetical protein